MEADIKKLLAYTGQWLTQQDIAKILGIPRNKVKYVIALLSKEKRIEVKRDINDLRKKYYRIIR